METASYTDFVFEPETNIVIFKLADTVTNELFLNELEKHHIKAIGFGPQYIRMVTHLDFTKDMLKHCLKVFKEIQF